MKRKVLFLASTIGLIWPGMSQNLISNGDFSAGNAGFTVSAELPNFCGCLGQTYCVVPNSGVDKCGVFTNTQSPSSDSFMVIDGFRNTPSNDVIWSQTVAGITNGTAYSFGFNVISVYNNDNPNLMVTINNDPVLTIMGNQISLTQWNYFTASWVGDATGTAEVEIHQLAPYSGGGYDFGIDDITLVPGCQGGEVAADFDFNYNPCTGVVQFTSLDSRATSWYWEFGDGSTSTLQNPVHVYNNAPLPTGFYGPGVYLLVESAGGCLAATHASDLYFYRETPGHISITGADQTYCVGEVITLTATSSVYPDYDRFVWDATGLGNVVGQSGQEAYIYITSATGGNVTVTTDNDCGSAGNVFVNAQECCTNTKLTGLSVYSNAQTLDYNYTDINENALYGASIYCNQFAQLNRGASSMDIEGNYYYVDGNYIYKVEDATCNLTRTNINAINSGIVVGDYSGHMEPEFNADVLWTLAYGNGSYVLQEVTPDFIHPNAPQSSMVPSHITRVIEIGNYPPVPGSSTFNPSTGKYYYVLDESGITSTGPLTIRPKLGTVVEINVYSGMVNTFTVLDMDGVYNDGTAPVFVPVLQELEYNPITQEILATVQHYVEQTQQITFLPGGPGVITGPGQFEPILTNGGMGGALEPVEHVITRNVTVVVASTDVVSFPIAEAGRRAGNARIVASNVSYDAYSSSTLDIAGQRYLLTGSNGLNLYQVDIAGQTVTLQTGSSPTNAKENRRIYEIEYLNCGTGSTGARPSNSLTSEIEDVTPILTTSIQPNPSNTGTFQVMVEASNTEATVTIEVLDVYGHIIQYENNVTTAVQVNVAGLPKGMYFVRITNGERTELKKVIYH